MNVNGMHAHARQSGTAVTWKDVRTAADRNFNSDDADGAYALAKSSGRGARFALGAINTIGPRYLDSTKLTVLNDVLDAHRSLGFTKTVLRSASSSFDANDKAIAVEDAMFSSGHTAKQIRHLFLVEIKDKLANDQKIPYEQQRLGTGRDGV